jgi:magnesium-transporting ATPase (P-type)
MKEIVKDIIIRQLVIPITCLFLLVLLLPKVTAILATKTPIEPQLLATAFIVITFATLFGIWYVWYPYTCIRIWKAGNELSPGWRPKLAKGYATIVLLIIIVPGLSALPKLPDIYSALDSYNNSLSTKDAQKKRASS